MVTRSSDAARVEGLLNLRDLGGLPLEGGGVTLAGRLLRSDSPHNLDESGGAALWSLGVRTVVDLRTAAELAAHPSPLPDFDGVRVVHAPIFTDDDQFPRDLVTAADVYGWWLRELREGVGAAFRAVATAPEPGVLVHCHAGKDRTGVIVALVLRLAGVGVDAIADDYALSGEQLADMLARDRESAVERGMDEVHAERLFTVRREAMVETLEAVEREHGDVTTLLREIGLEEDSIDRLRALLTAPGWPRRTDV